MDSKELALQKIAGEIENCPICKVGTSGRPVPGEGSPDAKILFLGEAPGKTEAETGRPFVGRSGKLLTTLIKSLGLKREDAYITSPVKYYPGMRAPTPLEISHGKTHLAKQLEIIKPSLIVLLGNTAAKAMLPPHIYVISKDHGKIVTHNNQKYFITYHPAAVVRFQKNLQLIQNDFMILKEELKKY